MSSILCMYIFRYINVYNDFLNTTNVRIEIVKYHAIKRYPQCDYNLCEKNKYNKYFLIFLPRETLEGRALRIDAKWHTGRL